jgi:glutamate racemase
MTIAFFDSGIGGLTVLAETIKYHPNEHYLYWADTANVPYGTKSKTEVRQLILHSVASLMNHPIEALVIACNTATSIAIEELRATYSIPIIGMEPAIKPAVALNREHGRRVLVIATPLTLKETKYHDLIRRIDDQSIVDSLPLPELVHFAEKLMFDHVHVVQYLQEKLSSFDLQEYGTLVLGCTHFAFFRPLFYQLIPRQMNIIDGNQGTVKRLFEVLNSSGNFPERTSPQIEFYSTGQDNNYINMMEQALAYYLKFNNR